MSDGVSASASTVGGAVRGLILRTRVRLARWILPRGWYVAENRSNFRDDFAGDFCSALSQGYYESPVGMEHNA